MQTPRAPPDSISEPPLLAGTGGPVAAADSLEAERLRLREILERMPDHVLLLDRDGRIEYVNRALARDLGTPAEAMIGHTPWEMGFTAPEFDPLRRDFARVVEDGEAVSGELTATAPAGRRTYSYTMTPITGPDGRVCSVMLNSRDVTPLVEAQTRLAESEAKYRNVVELAPDAILIHQDGLIVFVNPAAVAMLGADASGELIGRPVLGIVHPGTREVAAANIGLDLRGEESPLTTVEVLRPDGTTVTVQGRGALIPFGGRPAVQVVLRDVTKEKRAEAALRESEERLRLAKACAGIGNWEWHLPATGESGPREHVWLYDPGPDTVVIDDWRNTVHPDDLERVEAERDEALARREPFEVEFRYDDGSGRTSWMRVIGGGVFDEAGRLVRVLGVNMDVTEQKRAEAAVLESEHRHAFLLALGDRLRELADVREITAVATEMVGRHLEASGAVYCEVDEAGECATARADWTDGTVPQAVGRFPLDDFDIGDLYRRGIVRRTDEITAGYDGDAAHRAPGIRALLGVPICRSGRLAAVLALHSARPRAWTDAEVELARDAGDRVWAAVERARAEEALRASEERLRLAQESAGIGIWDRDTATGRVTISPEFLQQYGLDAEAITSYDDWARLIHPDDREQVEGGRQAAFAAGTSLELEFRVVLPSGDTRWIQFKGHGVGDGQGSLDRVVGVLIDVTDRRRTEETVRERERTLQSIFRAAPVGIGMVSHRIITQANDQLCRMTGYPRDELVGQDARIFYPSDEAYAYVGREKYARIMTEGIGAVETQWRRKDGTVRDILLSSSPVDLSRPHEDVVFIALDITRLRESERALESYMDDLQRSNEELQRFAYVASHDLQEPLRSIISFSQLLEKRYRGKLDQDADEFIAFIVEGGNRMQQLITDLLQLSRVETKAKPLVPTDAGEVAADALRMMETAICEAGATVTVGELPTVMADAAQLAQVFTNLVGNALKYRREGVPPEVRISAEQKDRMVEFSVQDNGIGIEAEYFDRIFVIFQRLHTRDEYEGTGIGLAVVRKIVERHGGHIRVESTPGEGSTFFFTLPAA